MKKKLFVFAVITAMVLGCTACGNNAPSETVDTEVSTKVIETVTPEVVPQEVEVKDLEPLADKGILTGVEDMTVAEGTKVDFNDLIYMDKTIVKGVDVDDSKVDYTKAGTYEVVYTITFDGEKLRGYIKENKLMVGFDTDGDTIIVKTTITVEVVTEEEAETAIAGGDTSVVTEETKADVQKKNESKANGNAVASTPAPDNGGSKNNGGNKNTGSNTGNKNNSGSSNNGNTGNKNNSGSSNTGSAEKPSNGNNNTGNSGNNGSNKPAEPTKPAETEKPAHTHSYSASVTKQPTCNSTGVKTYKCACGDSYTESIPATGSHNWQHHDEVGHYETVVIKEATREPICESVTICNGCGKRFTGGNQVDDAIEHEAFECESSYHTEESIVGYKDIPAVTEKRWVVDQKAYDDCTVCGARK